MIPSGVALGAVPVRAAPASGGVTLDGYGGLHPFGGVTLDGAGAPYWQGWDIARAIAVREDGLGGWTLDGYGGIHSWGSAPVIHPPVYWQGWDIARAFVVTSRDQSGLLDGRQGYVLDGYGGLHPWGGAPVLTGWPYHTGVDVARGLEIHLTAGVPDGGWVMDRDGRTVAFGAAPPLSIPGTPGGAAFQQLHLVPPDGGYLVGKYGVITGFGSPLAPNWSGYADWNAWDILRDVALILPSRSGSSPQPVSPAAMAAYQTWLHPHGGVTLDGYGGLHPFGGMGLDTRGAPYWQGWDVARAVVVRADGEGGWTLDAYGGIHAFGTVAAIATPVYWQNWYIARSMAITSKDDAGLPDGRQGYLMDGYGGLHPWGGAPPLAAPYTPGRDIARGLAIHEDAGGVPDGGWILDRDGSITAFGAAPPLTVSGQPAAPVLQQLHLVGSGGYTVSKWGPITVFGSGIAPYWAGWLDWGAWDILRDVALIDPTNPQPAPQPISALATGRLDDALNLRYTLIDPLIAQHRNLDCEAAALHMALLVPGTDVSEDWILGQIGADLRAPIRDQYGNILQWGDPYQTFVGNVNGFEYNATGYGVYAPPIADTARVAGRSSLWQEGWSPRALYLEVASGNPAVVWVPVYKYWSSAVMRTWTAWDGRAVRYTLAEHAMTLVGVDAAAGTVTLNDPNGGHVRTVSMASFEAAFAKFNDMAAVVY